MEGTTLGAAVEALRSGGMSWPLMPLGSFMYHTFSQLLVPPGVTFSWLQVIEPSERFQPSPNQGAAACTLWLSLTEPDEYPRFKLGVKLPGPGGTLSG